MRWDYRIAVTFVMVMVLFAAGACGNGGTADLDEPGSQPEDPIQLLYNGDDRLPNAASPGIAEIFGRIELMNLTLAEETANGVSATVGGTASQIPQEKILVRVIDPSEDILIAEVHPDLTGHFKVTLVNDYPVVNVEVGFAVIEDLNGDGEEGDLVEQVFPVAPKLGKAASMDAKFSRTLPRDLPDIPDMGDKPGVEIPLRPETGYMLVTQLVVEDANGSHEDVYGINFETNTIVYDTDNDNTLEFGDDFVGDDSDLNGLVDSFEEPELPADLPDPETAFLSGVITKVDSAGATMSVRLDDGTVVTVLVDPRVAIEHVVYSESLDGNQISGPLTLDGGLIGRHCQIIALPVTDGFLAEWILVSEGPTPEAFMAETLP